MDVLPSGQWGPFLLDDGEKFSHNNIHSLSLLRSTGERIEWAEPVQTKGKWVRRFYEAHHHKKAFIYAHHRARSSRLLGFTLEHTFHPIREGHMEQQQQQQQTFYDMMRTIVINDRCLHFYESQRCHLKSRQPTPGQP